MEHLSPVNWIFGCHDHKCTGPLYVLLYHGVENINVILLFVLCVLLVLFVVFVVALWKCTMSRRHLKYMHTLLASNPDEMLRNSFMDNARLAVTGLQLTRDVTSFSNKIEEAKRAYTEQHQKANQGRDWTATVEETVVPLPTPTKRAVPFRLSDS
jgi:heme/copper-type cytochrome/quinol oxidase subunit 2